MSFIDSESSGGFGNRCMKYAFARAYAEKHGCTLRTTPWVGQQIFEIDDPPMPRWPDGLPEVDTFNFEDWDGKVDVAIRGDPQHQKHLIYTRADAKRWFTFRPAILDLLKDVPTFEIAAHLRWGDFVGHAGFISIAKESYLRACDQYSLDRSKLRFIGEEDPIVVPGIDSSYRWKGRTSDNVPGFSFLPDFYALIKAKVLLRGPSTFSWWAGVLGDHERIFSPDQRGIAYDGGDRGFQEVPFVEGNHSPITAWWKGHSELHLSE